MRLRFTVKDILLATLFVAVGVVCLRLDMDYRHLSFWIGFVAAMFCFGMAIGCIVNQRPLATGIVVGGFVVVILLALTMVALGIL